MQRKPFFGAWKGIAFFGAGENPETGGDMTLKRIWKERKGRMPAVILAAAAFPMGICLEAPFVVYGGNAEELQFSLGDFFPICLLVWFAAALVTGCVLFFLPDKAYRFVFPIVVALALLLFLQGTYLNLGRNFLPGDNMGEEPLSTTALVVNTAIWIVGLGLAVGSAFLQKREILRIAAVLIPFVLVGTQVVNIVFTALSNDGIGLSKEAKARLENPDYEVRVMTNDGLTTPSSGKNVVYFVVDRFDEAYAEWAYRETPDVYDELAGFTWFQDNIAMFGHTYPAVAWMLTNQPYSSAQSRSDYYRQAYDEQADTPLKRLHEAGYSVRLYTQSYYAYGDAFDLPDYIDNVIPRLSLPPTPWSYRFETAGNMMRVALYRCLPFLLKDAVGKNLSSNIGAAPPIEETLYTTDMKEVNGVLTASPFTTREGNGFYFIHIDGCHDVTYNEQWEVPQGEEASDYAVAVRTSFQIIDRYLREMKRLGVYDGATIVITGDHSAPHNDGREVCEPRLTALFVKPSGVGTGELRRSGAQVAQTDLWATIFQSEGLPYEDYGTSVFDVPEGQDRKRTHRWQTYSTESLDEWVYEIDGPGENFENWTAVSHERFDKFLMD